MGRLLFSFRFPDPSLPDPELLLEYQPDFRIEVSYDKLGEVLIVAVTFLHLLRIQLEILVDFPMLRMRTKDG